MSTKAVESSREHYASLDSVSNKRMSIQAAYFSRALEHVYIQHELIDRRSINTYNDNFINNKYRTYSYFSGKTKHIKFPYVRIFMLYTNSVVYIYLSVGSIQAYISVPPSNYPRRFLGIIHMAR